MIETLQDRLRWIRFLADDYLELWAIAHQNHPIAEGEPGPHLWYWALAKRRTRLEMSLAEYRAELKVRGKVLWF